jgi:hypothetical protein
VAFSTMGPKPPYSSDHTYMLTSARRLPPIASLGIYFAQD